MGADITVLQAPEKVIAGCLYTLRVRVKNTSRVTWDGSFAVAAIVGSVEGPHSLLPPGLGPGDQVTITVFLEVPRQRGTFPVVVDVVREESYWFSEISSPGATFFITVLPHHREILAQYPVALDVTLDITNKCPLKCIQ